MGKRAERERLTAEVARLRAENEVIRAMLRAAEEEEAGRQLDLECWQLCRLDYT